LPAVNRDFDYLPTLIRKIDVELISVAGYAQVYRMFPSAKSGYGFELAENTSHYGRCREFTVPQKQLALQPCSERIGE
jgi:hypothetical protein